MLTIHKTTFALGAILCAYMMLFPHSTIAQERFLPGFVVKSAGDTLQGYIDYRNWSKNPNKIDFKSTLADPEQSFSPLDIKGFGTSGEIYVSGIVQAETSPRGISSLSDSAGFHFKTDTTFLQVIIDGEKHLLYYKNRSGTDFFYIEDAGKHELLAYKRYAVTVRGSKSVAENKQYVQQLVNYFQDCTSLQEKIKSTAYNLSSLEKLFAAYYECTGGEMDFQQETKRIKPEFGLLAGVSLTSLSLSGNAQTILNIPFEPSFNFSGGLSLDLSLPRNFRKWSIYNELTFSSYEVSGQWTNYTNEEYYEIYAHTIGFSYIKLNNMLRYKFPLSDALKIYINAGMSNGYALSETNHERKESRFYSTERVEERRAMEDSRRYEQGILAGIGLGHRKISLQLRMEIGNGFSDYASLKSTATRYYAFVGYAF